MTDDIDLWLTKVKNKGSEVFRYIFNLRVLWFSAVGFDSREITDGSQTSQWASNNS